MRLLGAEEVAQAGRNISGAADQITRAAEYMQSAVDQLQRALEWHADRIEAAKVSPNAPLGEAIEWESADGLHRTTDKAVAANWAPSVGVIVVRRATGGSA